MRGSREKRIKDCRYSGQLQLNLQSSGNLSGNGSVTQERQTENESLFVKKYEPGALLHKSTASSHFTIIPAWCDATSLACQNGQKQHFPHTLFSDASASGFSFANSTNLQTGN